MLFNILTLYASMYIEQSEKVKTLLKQCDSLRKQMLQLQKDNKDNIRVKKIKKLEVELEEKLVCTLYFYYGVAKYSVSLIKMHDIRIQNDSFILNCLFQIMIEAFKERLSKIMSPSQVELSKIHSYFRFLNLKT